MFKEDRKMNYTRRKVLVDAARVSLAAAASPLLRTASIAQARPSSFQVGIRVFFIGTWLLCKDPNADGLLAITADAGMNHKFPFGVWPGPTGINSKGSLKPNVSSGGKPYAVQVSGTQAPFATVQSLFNDASTKCGFTYIKNPNSDLLPNLTSVNDIIAISMPMPTRLLATSFSPGALLTSSDKNHPISTPGQPGTTHIFDYISASSLMFMGQSEITTGSATYNSDYHFHTVPSDCTPHGPMMLQYLLKWVLGVTSVQLTQPNPESTPDLGTCLPSSVDQTELDIPNPSDNPCLTANLHKAAKTNARSRQLPPEPHFPPLRTTASCAGASIGVGDGG
jgi:hypothetical protein